MIGDVIFCVKNEVSVIDSEVLFPDVVVCGNNVEPVVMDTGGVDGPPAVKYCF